MPIDLEALQADPDFKKLSPADQQEVLATARQRNQAAPAPPSQAPVSAGIEPLDPGGVRRVLANRTMDNPIVGIGGQAEPPQQVPGGGRFTPTEPPLEETHSAPSRFVPLIAGGLAGGPAAAAGVVTDGFGGGENAPANVGEAIGTTLAPGPLKPVAGALGAGAGEGVRQWWSGEPFDAAKIGKEAGWSLAPEVAESAGRGMVRQFARNSPGGQLLRFEQGARESRQLPEKVFQPKPASDISDAFNQVRAANVDVDLGDVTRHVSTLSPGKQADLLNTLTTLDRENKTGGRYAKMYQDFMSGQSMTRDIGALQDLRSHLRQEAEMLADKSSEAYQLIRNFQRAVDDTIDTGLVSNASAQTAQSTRDLLHQARKDWAQRVAADDLSDMVESKITSTGDLSSSTIQIRALYDELRRGRSQVSKSLNRALDLTPGARDRFEKEMHEIARLYETIQIPMTDVAGLSRMPVIAELRQALGQMLLTDRGRQMLREAVIEGRGTLSPNAVALLTNAYLRETRPELRGRPPQAREGVQSWFAPGGVARSTD